MALQNFKVQNGLDIEGVVLSASASELLVSGSPVALESYVDSAVAAIPGVSTGPGLTTNINGEIVPDIGTGLSVNAMTNDLEVDTTTIATKAYVDAVAQGLDVKDSVKVAFSGTFDVSALGFEYAATNEYKLSAGNSTFTLDGQTINAGDRVLFKDVTDQNSALSNTIYRLVDDAGDLYLRVAPDGDITNGYLTKGSFTFVESGTDAGKGYVATGFTGNGATWSQFSEAGSFITSVNSTQFDVTAGELALSASVVGDGLELNGSNQLAVKTDGTSLTFSNGELQVSSGLSLSNITATDANINGTVTITDSNSVFVRTKTASDQANSEDSDSFRDLIQVTATSEGTVEAISGEFFVTSEYKSGATTKRRVSKISWLWDGDLAAPGISYNEYSVIETGGSISGYDLQVVYESDNVVLEHKATLSTGETLTSQVYSVSHRPPTFA